MSEGQDHSSRSRTRTGTRHRPKLAMFVIAMVLIGVAVIYGPEIVRFASVEDNTADESTTIRRLPVLVTSVNAVSHYEQKRQYTGLVRTKQKADLGFELTGRIEQVLVDEGHIVKKNQLLAKLDTATLVARKDSIAASLRQAEAVLAELNAGPRQQTIDSLEAQLSEANSNFDLAKSNLLRRERLRGKAISQEEFDRARFTHQAAGDRVESLESQLAELLAGTREEKVTAQQAARDQLQFSLNEIVLQIDKGELRAPFGGKIVRRLIDSGSIVNATTPILTIVDFENLEAVIGVPISAAQNLHELESYSLKIADELFSANLIAKVQQLETSTRTQNLIFELEEYANQKIIPGQLCQIEVATDVAVPASTYSVPASSLTNGIRGLWSVLIVDPESSRIKKADVQIVYNDGKRALITGPLNEGDQVIADGTHRVIDGQYVTPVSERQAAAR